MEATAPVVLVGGGHAAAAFANSVRRAGYEGHVVLVSDEPVPPYHRPPLSKKYLADGLPVEQILIRAAAWYDEQRIELRLGQRAEAIDRQARCLRLAGGEALNYSQLVLLTGARPRRLAGRHRRRPAGRVGDAQPRRCRRDGAAPGGRPSSAGRRRRLHRAGGGGGRLRQGPAGDAARSRAAHPAARRRCSHRRLLPLRCTERTASKSARAWRCAGCWPRATASAAPNCRTDRRSMPTWCWSALAWMPMSNWPSRPGWTSTTASPSMSSAAARIRPSWRLATAAAFPSAAGASASNRCRTPTTRQPSPPTRWPERPWPTPRCPGSGRTNTTPSCRSRD